MSVSRNESFVYSQVMGQFFFIMNEDGSLSPLIENGIHANIMLDDPDQSEKWYDLHFRNRHLHIVELTIRVPF